MASKNLPFDPDAGVPYAANIALYSGADFKTIFIVWSMGFFFIFI